MKTLALSLLAAVVCATSARADAVYDNITTNGVAGITSGSSIGQSFVTGGTALSLNAFLFVQTSNGSDYSFTPGETVSLYGNDPVNNTPVAVALASFTLFQNGQNVTEADTNATTILTASTRYWLVLNAPTAADTVRWAYYNSAGYAANSLYGVSLPEANTAFKTMNGVTTYFTFSQGPQSIYLDADAVAGVPEPSTYAMFAVGGVGAFLFMRRARKMKVA